MASRHVTDEYSRLDTFPHLDGHFNGQSPQLLARAGFFYTGEGDKVKCYSCGITHKNWCQDDDPLEVHRRLNQDCPFINLTSDNIPLRNTAAENIGLVQGQHTNDNILMETIEEENMPAQSCSGDSITADTEATKSVIEQPHRESNESGDSEWKVISLSNVDSAVGPSNFTNNPRTRSSSIQIYMNKSNHEHRHYYYDEQVRQSTFKKWPQDSPLCPIELARCGFYYTGEGDRVKCAFCRGALHNWKVYDDPGDEHHLHFPKCRFLCDPQSAGNIPMRDQPLRYTQTAKPGQSIILERPFHGNYRLESKRLKSFMGLSSHEINQSPGDLAETGFFYAGIADNVKCFFCDGGLRNWERNDDPWTEHARCFPLCGFVRKIKGDEFIKKVSPKYVAPERHQRSMQRKANTSATEHRLTESELAGLMAGDIVQLACQMGCKRGDIQIVTICRMEQIGEFFVDAYSLYDEVKDYEAEYIDLQTVPREDKPSPATTRDSDIEWLMEERKCIMCLDQDRRVLFLPCRHLICCEKCAPMLQSCPICRENIRDKVRAYLSWTQRVQ